MRIEQEIGVDVTVHYLDIEGLRFKPQAGSDREAEFHAVRATSRLDREGKVARVYLSGVGKWVRKDGTVGLQDAKLVFSAGATLPPHWQHRIMNDLGHLADQVVIANLKRVVKV